MVIGTDIDKLNFIKVCRIFNVTPETFMDQNNAKGSMTFSSTCLHENLSPLMYVPLDTAYNLCFTEKVEFLDYLKAGLKEQNGTLLWRNPSRTRRFLPLDTNGSPDNENLFLWNDWSIKVTLPLIELSFPNTNHVMY